MFCVSCGAEIIAEDVNLTNRMAKCRACNAVFRFEPDSVNVAAQRARPLSAKPANVTVEDDGLCLRITRRWFTPGIILLLFFCIAWDTFLVFWYSNIGQVGSVSSGFGLMFVLFPIAHVAIGVGLTYYVFAAFVNQTVVSVDAIALSVSHGPLPWIGARTIPRGEVQQLYVERTSSRSENSTSDYYHVNAVTTSGSKVRLLTHVGGADEAAYFEQVIEDRLGIRDEPVAGEFKSA